MFAVRIEHRYHKKIEVKCHYCGNLFRVFPSIIKIGKGKYCNRKCYNDSMKKSQNKNVYKKGHIVTKEIRDKISNSKKGCIGYWVGKKRSEETKKKISKALFVCGEKESGKRKYIKSRKYNLKYQLNQRMREGLYRTLKKGVKNGRHWEDLVGYSFSQLKKHLQKTMPSNCTWTDFLSGKLHVDHIVPISVFNFNKTSDTDFKRCWALKNLQLLPARENIIKSNKLTKHFQPSLIFG